MMDQAVSRLAPPGMDGLLQHVQHEVRPHRARDAPPDEAAGAGILIDSGIRLPWLCS